MEPRKVAQTAGCAIVGIAYPLMALVGLVIHVWTIVIAFAVKGLFAAAVSLVFPVLAQLYWGLAIWRATGTLANPYCMALLAYVGLWILIFVGAGMASRE